MSGWKLSTALVIKHFGKLGDSLAATLATLDPETATEVDREKLEAQLKDVARKLVVARKSYDKELVEANDLAELIAKDEKAVEILIRKFEEGVLDEATLNEFASNLEAQKARLPGEQQDAADAKELMDALQDIFGTLEKRIADFDQQAKEAQRLLARASAEKERQSLRQQQQDELKSLHSGLSKTSTALGALRARAEKMQTEAEAAKLVTDSAQKPLDQANAVEEARRIAAGTSTAGESAVERLRRAAAAK